MDQNRNCYFYRTKYVQVKREYRYVGTFVKMLSIGEIQLF